LHGWLFGEHHGGDGGSVGHVGGNGFNAGGSGALLVSKSRVGHMLLSRAPFDPLCVKGELPRQSVVLWH
jgi:hypothetical protein